MWILRVKMLDWGPDDWGLDVDWSSIEQQAVKKRKTEPVQSHPSSHAVQEVR